MYQSFKIFFNDFRCRVFFLLSGLNLQDVFYCHVYVYMFLRQHLSELKQHATATPFYLSYKVEIRRS